jgi:hypothetical protein
MRSHCCRTTRPVLAVTPEGDALFAAQIDLHINAIRATASGNPALHPSD